MKEYEITITETLSQTVTVEAENEQQAMLEIDGATISHFITGVVVGWSITVTIDRIFNPKPHQP